MYVTTKYIGTERGGVAYLIFLLTEDYIEANNRISAAIRPLLDNFAQDIGKKGALVRPFLGKEKETLGNAVEKNWDEKIIMRMRYELPALLIIDVDFDNFDPQKSDYLLIFLRELIDEFGNVKVFELHELLDALTEGVRRNDLFASAKTFFSTREKNAALNAAWDAIEVKPGVWGVSVDLKKGLEFVRSLLRGTTSISSPVK